MRGTVWFLNLAVVVSLEMLSVGLDKRVSSDNAFSVGGVDVFKYR